MAGISPRHAATAAGGGRDALGLPNTLGAVNMHTKDTLETSDEHDTEDPLSEGHSVHTTEANKEEDDHDVGKAMHAVLDTSELLEMVLSHLSTKDLTRFLAVSKYWQRVMLGSIPLRRSLFLEAAPEKWYLYHESVPVGELPMWQSRWSIIREPKERTTRIIELHPALVPYSKSTTNFSYSWVRTCWMSCKSLRAVHPSTYLSQPPLKNLHLEWDSGELDLTFDSLIQRAGGVTFGDVLEVMDKTHITRLPYVGNCLHYSDVRSREEIEETCKLFAGEVAATDDDEMVIRAREDLAKRQSSIEAKGPDAYNDR